MAMPDIDLNLLFGVIALQDDLIDQAQFTDVCAGWALRMEVPLADLLIERKWLTPADRAAIERKIERKLKKNRGDVRATLGEVAGIDARDAIRAVDDPRLRQSLSGMPAAPGHVLVETLVPPQVREANRYTLTRLHAEGGLGRVWLARDCDLNRDVALKEIRPDQSHFPATWQRFLKEAQITGQLEHPGIVPVYELARRSQDAQPFYVMRLVRGQTLRDAIQDHHRRMKTGTADPLSYQKLLSAFISICQAVGYAHARGVVHRDLKPENVVMGAFGEVIVLDWGLAKIVDRDQMGDDTSDRISISTEAEAGRTQGVIGTPAYMAPEQVEARHDLIDGRTDTYGLGGILYEILTGRPPADGPTTAEVYKQILAGAIVPPCEANPGVPRGLQAICLKALSRERAKRYSRATELAEEVRRWMANEPVSAWREPFWERASRWGRRHRTWVRAAAVALLITTGISVLAALLVADARRKERSALLGKIAERERAEALRQSELQRFELLRTETDSLVEAGQAALRARDPEAARLRLFAALEKIGREKRLMILRTRAQGYLAEADQQLADGKERTAVRARLEQFTRHYDEALFHGTLFTGIDPASSLLRARKASRDALSLFGLGDAPESRITLPGRHLTEAEKVRVRAGCFELIVLLSNAELVEADMKDAPATAQAAARRAGHLLDCAEHLLPGSQAPRLWRAGVQARMDGIAPTVQVERPPQRNGPMDAADQFLVGLSHYYAQDLEASLHEFDATLRSDPEHFWALYFTALCQLKLARWPEAKASLTACLSRRPAFPWAFMLRGYVHGELREFEFADRDYQQALDLAPGSYAVYVNRSITRLGQRRYADAIADLRAAADLEPRQYQAFANLAEVYHRQQRFDAAIAAIDRAIALQPQLSTLWRNRALIHLDQGDRVAAESDYAEGMRLERPGSAYALLLQAEAQLANGRPADAIQAFDQYARHGVLDAQFFQGRGLARALVKDYPGAVDDYTKALSFEANSNLRTRRGWAYLYAPEQLALRDFNAALEINPANLDARLGRGNALVKMGRYREAVEDAEAGLQPAPRDWQMAFNSACILAQAFSKAKSDGQQPGGSELASHYRDRALELLRVTLSLLPSDEQRRHIWKSVIASDSAIEPIRSTDGYSQLQARFHSP